MRSRMCRRWLQCEKASPKDVRWNVQMKYHETQFRMTYMSNFDRRYQARIIHVVENESSISDRIEMTIRWSIEMMTRRETSTFLPLFFSRHSDKRSQRRSPFAKGLEKDWPFENARFGGTFGLFFHFVLFTFFIYAFDHMPSFEQYFRAGGQQVQAHSASSIGSQGALARCAALFSPIAWLRVRLSKMRLCG